MNEFIKMELDEAKSNMDKALSHTDLEFLKIRAGKASVNMLDGIMVDYYGAATALGQVANVNTPDARTIVVQPWEKNMISPIEKAIMEANIGLNPQNDGIIIRLNVPPLTEERRRDLVKKVKEESERGKITIRNIRKATNESIKKLKNDGASEDDIKLGEIEVQKLTDAFIVKVDLMTESKEKDVMTV